MAEALEAQRLLDLATAGSTRSSGRVGRRAGAGIRSDRVLRGEDAVKALFLDPVLDVAASAVDLLDDAPRLRQIRHHDAGIVTRRAVTESNHLGFAHDTAVTAALAERLLTRPRVPMLRVERCVSSARELSPVRDEVLGSPTSTRGTAPGRASSRGILRHGRGGRPPRAQPWDELRGRVRDSGELGASRGRELCEARAGDCRGGPEDLGDRLDRAGLNCGPSPPRDLPRSQGAVVSWIVVSGR